MRVCREGAQSRYKRAARKKKRGEREKKRRREAVERQEEKRGDKEQRETRRDKKKRRNKTLTEAREPGGGGAHHQTSQGDAGRGCCLLDAPRTGVFMAPATTGGQRRPPSMPRRLVYRRPRQATYITAKKQRCPRNDRAQRRRQHYERTRARWLPLRRDHARVQQVSADDRGRLVQ